MPNISVVGFLTTRFVSCLYFAGGARELGNCNRKRKLIRIVAGLTDEEAIGTLLHEMVHAAINEYHGMRRHKEMVRLSKAGAPFSAAELEGIRNGWHTRRLTKKSFRVEVEDVLMEAPQVTLPQVVRHFIRSEGGASAVPEFLRRYPWVRQVFQEAKKHDSRDRWRRSDNAVGPVD